MTVLPLLPAAIIFIIGAVLIFIDGRNINRDIPTGGRRDRNRR